jgi:hypothetical protein
MDGRANNGGKRPGAGRPKKSDEKKLIERLGMYEETAHRVLEECVNNKQKWAVQLYFNYMYGKPKETKDISINAEQPLFDF